jgi:hypothetical protein
MAVANSMGQPQGRIYSWLIVKKEQQKAMRQMRPLAGGE